MSELPSDIHAKDLVIVNLDTGNFVNPFPENKLPEPHRANLVRRLGKILIPHIVDLDSAFPPNDPLNNAYGLLSSSTNSTSPINGEMQADDINRLIRTAFLLFFVEIFHDYREGIVMIRKYPSPIASFDKMKFLRNKSSQLKPFLTEIFETQGFQQFLEQSYLFSQNIFDLAIWHFNNGDSELSY
eukprot:TRINITY_DN25659_c0_g1_i1.p1 TRINITY_DN25659_c0_g1~~TRINITY_DN25659_c0_g1_i1.p1  ORF type:complete len:216 (+),score=51.55 TRINITY_DN25659_c0_g1_i1:95-649(+)